MWSESRGPPHGPIGQQAAGDPSAICSTGSRAPSPPRLTFSDASWNRGARPSFAPTAPPRATLTAGLHADQLQLYALDGGLRALDHQLPGQRLRDDTVGGVEVPSDEKFGEQGSLERDKGWWERKVPRELTPEAVTGYKEKLKTKLGNFYKTRWAPVVQNGKKVQ